LNKTEFTLNKPSFDQVFILFFLIVLLGTGCTHRKKSQQIIQNIKVEEEIGLSMFDGKTLDGWEITDFGPQGPVYVSEGKIILGMGEGCTGITWKRDFPDINYEVTLDAMRINGTDFFCGMTFPVNKDPCTLIVGGWGGTVVGLSSIDGKDASENATSTLRKFELNRWYHIGLRVTGKEITSWIDNDTVVDFDIGNRKLSIRPEVGLLRPFGIASWTTTAALRNIRVKKINGVKE
jgi:hypothetical protein